MGIKMRLSESVNKLIADEWIAEYTYENQSYLCKGAAFDAVSSRLEEMAKDEKKHKQWLIEWMQSQDLPVIINPVQLLKLCNPACRYEDFDDPIDTLECIRRGIKAEINAKNMYVIYYNAVKDMYPDLANLYMEIAREENEHKVELTDLLGQIQSNG